MSYQRHNVLVGGHDVIIVPVDGYGGMWSAVKPIGVKCGKLARNTPQIARLLEPRRSAPRIVSEHINYACGKLGQGGVMLMVWSLIEGPDMEHK